MKTYTFFFNDRIFFKYWGGKNDFDLAWGSFQRRFRELANQDNIAEIQFTETEHWMHIKLKVVSTMPGNLNN